eukprot:3686836-Pleurochrysis_carterae.AAC.1
MGGARDGANGLAGGADAAHRRPRHAPHGDAGTRRADGGDGARRPAGAACAGQMARWRANGAGGRVHGGTPRVIQDAPPRGDGRAANGDGAHV